MNKTIIKYALGRLLLIEALLLCAPLIVSIIYQEHITYISSYLSTIAILGIIGYGISYKRPKGVTLRAREGAVIVALSWILLSFFGGLPFVFSGDIPSIVDAFFETASGLTTTGSSILSSVNALSKSNLFWRSFTHLIGGMGVLVFALAILPNDNGDVQLMRAEVPGPIFGKIVSRVKDTARIMYSIYLALVALLVIILCLGGVPLYDSLLLSFGTAGTGGFSANDLGFSIYSNPIFVEYAIAIGMIVFGINFNLYFLILLGYFKDVFKDEELKYYLLIIVVSVIAIVVSLLSYIPSLEENFRHTLFTVSSIITTTGYSTADFAQWPIIAQMILFSLMFIGGCAGSTAGGLKVSRIVLAIKESYAELKRIGQPNRVVTTNFNQKLISKKEITKISNYILVYIGCFVILLFSVSIESKDFTTAISSVAATFNNIGPGLNAVGPTQNFSFYSDFNKIMLSLGMIAGRLEIYPMIILFAPTTIKKLLKSK